MIMYELSREDCTRIERRRSGRLGIVHAAKIPAPPADSQRRARSTARAAWRTERSMMRAPAL